VLKDIDNLKSETYRQRLLADYPSSEYSRILSDPDYYNKLMESRKTAQKLYSSAYDKYSGEDYYGAISICDTALDEFPQDELAPKFMLLRSYSTARVSDERTFKEELDKIIKRWPGTPEADKAVELAGWVTQKVPELKIEEDKEIAGELYVADTIPVHSVALAIMNPSFNINQASFDVISYNIDNYTNQNYRTAGTLVDNKYIMILVSGFSTNKAALEYYRGFNPDILIRNPSGVRILSFMINSINLKALEQDKNPERYYLFFTEKYLSWQKNR